MDNWVHEDIKLCIILKLTHDDVTQTVRHLTIQINETIIQCEAKAKQRTTLPITPNYKTRPFNKH